MSLAQLKIGAAIVLTSPFVPMLFQGEEWGASTPFLFFTDHGEPKLAKCVGEGRCKEFVAFGWDPAEVPHPQDRATFRRSKLKWKEVARSPHAELLAWHKALIRLRRREPSLLDGRLDRVEVNFDEHDKWMTIGRGDICVLCNFSNRSQYLPLSEGPWKALLTSADTAEIFEGGAELPSEAVVILKRG